MYFYYIICNHFTGKMQWKTECDASEGSLALIKMVPLSSFLLLSSRVASEPSSNPAAIHQSVLPWNLWRHTAPDLTIWLQRPSTKFRRHSQVLTTVRVAGQLSESIGFWADLESARIVRRTRESARGSWPWFFHSDRNQTLKPFERSGG